MQLLAVVVAVTHFSTTVAVADNLQCAQSASPDTEIYLLGQGHCVNRDGLLAASWTCSSPPCPEISDEPACSMLCLLDSRCTGFELRSIPINSTTGDANEATTVGCFLLVPVPTANAAAWPWVHNNGTQLPPYNRSVMSADGATDACCYKRAYPRPNPPDNPVRAPPPQSRVQKDVFAQQALLAGNASAHALPRLTKLIDYCLVGFFVFVFVGDGCVARVLFMIVHVWCGVRCVDLCAIVTMRCGMMCSVGDNVEEGMDMVSCQHHAVVE